MFTDEDYKDYINAVIELETAMIFFSSNLAHQVEDQEVLAKLAEILNDEIRHYGIGRGLCFSFFPEKEEDENAPENVYAKGMVTVTKETGECIDTFLLIRTPEGIGVESSGKLESGQCLDVEMRLNDAKSSERKKGEVSWVKPINPSLDVVAIKFK